MTQLVLPKPCPPRNSRLQDPVLPGYPDGIQGKPEPSLPTSLAQECFLPGRAWEQSIKAGRHSLNIRQGPGSRRAREMEPGTDRRWDLWKAASSQPRPRRAPPPGWEPGPLGLPLSSCNCPPPSQHRTPMGRLPREVQMF